LDGYRGSRHLKGFEGSRALHGLNIWILEKGQRSEIGQDYMSEIGLRSVINPVQVWVGVLWTPQQLVEEVLQSEALESLVIKM
jgi:hypothetical protein